jgi:hypothetical protein
MTDVICGGQHQSKEWTKAEIIEHLKNNPCIDCYCDIPFKRKND